MQPFLLRCAALENEALMSRPSLVLASVGTEERDVVKNARHTSACWHKRVRQK